MDETEAKWVERAAYLANVLEAPKNVIAGEAAARSDVVQREAGQWVAGEDVKRAWTS